MSNRGKPRVHVIKWAVIDQPERGTRSVLEPANGVSPVLQGDLDRVPLICACGECGVTLVEGVSTSQIRHLVIHCPECRAYNESLDS